MLWALNRKTAHISTIGLSMSSILAAHALNTAKSMMPAHPLSLTKQQSQCIALDPSVTNSYIYIDAPGNKTPEERGIKLWTERWRDIFLLFFFLVSLGVLAIRAPTPPRSPLMFFTAANCFATSSPSSLSCQIRPWCIIIATLGGNP